ncbi:MAG: hypothetical protein R3C59_10615 [Planctomycetaceae bacterium]
MTIYQTSGDVERVTETPLNIPPQPTVCPGDLFLSLLLLAEVLLLVMTWPLWTTIDRFPAVPLLTAVVNVPVSVDRTLTAILCLTTVIAGIGVWRKGRHRSPSADSIADSLFIRGCLGSALFCGLKLVILNQHRLQPWHWLFLLVIAQRLFVPPRQRQWPLRLTVAGIYIVAALSRLGSNVDQGMTREILHVMCRVGGLGDLLRNDEFVSTACLGMTLFELATGMVLMCPALWRPGVVMAVAIHVCLLLALGPWGLNHHSGVLIWNGFFILAVPVLFRVHSHDVSFTPADWSWRTKLAATFVLAFPLSGLAGLADNWPSWQLYSPRPEVVRIFVRQDTLSQLPDSVQAVAGLPGILDDWCPVRMDRWSLNATLAPIYPEDRFQLAIAEWLVQTLDSPERVKVTIDRPRIPWWWQRQNSEQMVGRRAVVTDESFFFNAVHVRTKELR